ncbi:MAG: hypothetical protein K8E66_05975, partial [Phycisphaerales bacterium]|nr:hypothetical protein [Phycisphaerales bacterium]
MLVIEAEVTPLFRGRDDRCAIVFRDCTDEARREERLKREADEQRVYASVLDALQRPEPIEERAQDAVRAILEFPEYVSMRVVRFVDERVIELANVPAGDSHAPIDHAELRRLTSEIDLHGETKLPRFAGEPIGDEPGERTCVTPIRHQGLDVGAIMYRVRPGYRCGARYRIMPRMVEEMFANAIVRDRLESGLREALDGARRASEAKDLFLANMSHELRTPINAILGFAEMLEHAAQAGIASQQKQITGIRRNASRLLAMVADVLDQGSFESGVRTIERGPCRVESMCNGLLSRHAADAMGKGVAISIEYNGHEDLVVYTDGELIDQLLSNLIGNAIKFTNRGGVTLGVS